MKINTKLVTCASGQTSLLVQSNQFVLFAASNLSAVSLHTSIFVALIVCRKQ